MTSRQDEAALERAWRAFAGQRDPDMTASMVIGRIRFADAVKRKEPAIAHVALRTVAESIIPVEGLRAAVRGMRPDMTPQRVGQLVNSWIGEPWFGATDAGSRYTLTSSLHARVERQRREAVTAHRVAGAKGGRPKKSP
jgi:Mg-chelatase subunit ChlI